MSLSKEMSPEKLAAENSAQKPGPSKPAPSLDDDFEKMIKEDCVLAALLGRLYIAPSDSEDDLDEVCGKRIASSVRMDWYLKSALVERCQELGITHPGFQAPILKDSGNLKLELEKLKKLEARHLKKEAARKVKMEAQGTSDAPKNQRKIAKPRRRVVKKEEIELKTEPVDVGMSTKQKRNSRRKALDKEIKEEVKEEIVVRTRSGRRSRPPASRSPSQNNTRSTSRVRQIQVQQMRVETRAKTIPGSSHTLFDNFLNVELEKDEESFAKAKAFDLAKFENRIKSFLASFEFSDDVINKVFSCVQHIQLYESMDNSMIDDNIQPIVEALMKSIHCPGVIWYINKIVFKRNLPSEEENPEENED